MSAFKNKSRQEAEDKGGGDPARRSRKPSGEGADDPSLVHRLLQVRVRPYYLYACDLILGSAHWRVPVGKGLEIIRSLRGWTSGYAVPQFVIDAPGGGGKIPLNPDYVENISEDGKFTLRNFRGERFVY